MFLFSQSGPRKNPSRKIELLVQLIVDFTSLFVDAPLNYKYKQSSYLR